MWFFSGSRIPRVWRIKDFFRFLQFLDFRVFFGINIIVITIPGIFRDLDPRLFFLKSKAEFCGSLRFLSWVGISHEKATSDSTTVDSTSNLSSRTNRTIEKFWFFGEPVKIYFQNCFTVDLTVDHKYLENGSDAAADHNGGGPPAAEARGRIFRLGLQEQKRVRPLPRPEQMFTRPTAKNDTQPDKTRAQIQG